MKIATAQQDYTRLIDSASIKPTPQASKSESVLDPLNRPVEQTPVEAVRQALQGGGVRKRAPGTDVVQISSLAKDSVSSQAKVEEMMQKELAKILEAEGVDLSGHQGMDYSPDAVSQRIVEYSISLYGVFRKQNQNLSEQQAMDKFETTIRGAVESGFGAAQKALAPIGLPDSVGALAEQTRSLVNTRFDEFFAKSRN